MREHDAFLAMYCNSASAVDEWMQTYYRRPKPEFLPAAIIEGRNTGVMLPSSSFSMAVFMSRLFKASFRKEEDRRKLVLQSLLAASNGENIDLDMLETLLRSLYLADDPLCDLILQQQLKSMKELNHDASDAGLLAASLTPPVDGSRPHFSTWPIPVINLQGFESHIMSLAAQYGAVAMGSQYGRGSLYLLRHMQAAAQQSAADPKRFRSHTAPALASLVTCQLVDAYWAGFYSTGDPVYVDKVLDVATQYVDFFEEFGDAWVTQYRQPPPPPPSQPSGGLAAKAVDYDGVPPDIADDPLATMRFETSRYALWTFLINASTHTAVCDAFKRHTGRVADSLSVLDSTSVEARMTVFGRKRLRLLELLMPQVAQLATQAGQSGIGSGTWPTSYGQGAGPATANPAWAGAAT